MKKLILSTGGTIDKVYYDALSDYKIGKSFVPRYLEESKCQNQYDYYSICQKDSLDLTEQDRADILAYCQQTAHRHILITHGTDTMVETAQQLEVLAADKCIIFTGAFQPARFRYSDAYFNVAFALGAMTSLETGIYIAMHGQLFSTQEVKKNRQRGFFEKQ